MELHRPGIKFFVADPAALRLLEFIPVFHRWIQTRALDDLLIDVADYSHVHAGPGILLIAHEGNYGVDETGNRRGLVYYRKRPLQGDLVSRLAGVCAKALKACLQLEQEPALQGRIQFRGDQLQVFVNDRLAAPNREETYRAFEPALGELLARLYPGADCSLAGEADPKERFAITVKSPEPVGVDVLLDRLGV